MELRTELMPPSLHTEEVEQLVTLADHIIAAMEQGQDANPVIAAFNTAASSHCTLKDFADAYGSIGTRAFVEDLLIPEPHSVEDITEADLLEMVKRVMSAEYSESMTHYWLRLLDCHVPHPAISDLIFHTELEPEEMLRQALAYKPTQLGSFDSGHE